jgi:uncharacterized membrane protein
MLDAQTCIRVFWLWIVFAGVGWMVYMLSTYPIPAGLLIAATVTSGLAAGLLYGFACAVMPGLSNVDDTAFVAVMQSVNRSILNPWFLMTFIGAPLLIIASVVGRFVTGGSGPWWPIITALILAMVSVLITVTVNVPLNNALDAAGSVDPAAVREAFEGRWVSWNIARTVMSTAAFAFLAAALVLGV